jgi:hypothetical protein
MAVDDLLRNRRFGEMKEHEESHYAIIVQPGMSMRRSPLGLSSGKLPAANQLMEFAF